MHPLKFIEPSAIRGVQMEGESLKTLYLQDCLDSFRENARLVLGLAAAPGFSAMASMQWVEAGTKAAREVFGKKYAGKLPTATVPQRERHWILTNKYMGEIVAAESPLLQDRLSFATNMLEQIVMNCGPYVHGIFESVLKTIVIQSWGTFEALTRMIWARAIESSNGSLVRPTDKEWKRERLGFGSRTAIRRTFEFGFNADNTDIRAALSASVIDPLAVLRNVLVHHAGKVDQSFKDDSDGLPLLATYRAQNLNTPILIDGVLVFSVVDPALNSGYQLIRAIDTWLASHQ